MNEKPQFTTRKKYIQKKMVEGMSLHVDQQKPNGYENSNDRNTARRAFSNTNLLSSILNTCIDVDILRSFHII